MNKLLEILLENPRFSDEQIASMLNTTLPEVKRQIGELENIGLIKGYRAVVDWDKSDHELVEAIIEIKVTPQKNRGFEEIAQVIASFDEVQTVYLMSGGYDIAAVISGKTFKDVATFVSRTLAPLDSVMSTATHFVLKRYKDNGIFFDDTQTDEREGISV